MTTSQLAELHRLLEAEFESPLGIVREQSNRALSPVSRGLQAAADNLLAKALRATGEDDAERACRYVERAVDLPFDDHEQVGPAWWSAFMVIFLAIGDRLDGCPEDDDSWLTAAEHVLERCDPLAAPALQGALASIVNDRSLPRAEAKRCRRLVGAVSGDDWYDNEPADRQDRLATVLAVVAAAVAYQRTVP